MKKEFGKISDLLKDGRAVEWYRSMDTHNTGIYWTDYDRDKSELVNAQFDLLRFDYDGGDKHEIYIRFPGTEDFIEMMGGGTGSGRGNMTISRGTNVWSESFYKRKIEIFSQEPQLLLTVGDSLPEFNFMSLIARRVSKEREGLYRGSSKPVNFNVDDFNQLSTSNYIKIPDDVRKVEYLYKTTGFVKNLTFCIHYPAYNFQYMNHSFMVIDGETIKEYKIVDFQRYKDGGTTIITVIDDNEVQHKFFSPTRLGNDKGKIVTWDDEIALTEITDKKEVDDVVKLLGIELEPVPEKLW